MSMIQLPRFFLDRTGQPFFGAYAVDDGPIDPYLGIDLEIDSLVKVEPIYCVEKPEETVADEIRIFDSLGQLHMHASGQSPDHWRVTEYQCFLEVLGSGLLVFLPDSFIIHLLSPLSLFLSLKVIDPCGCTTHNLEGG